MFIFKGKTKNTKQREEIREEINDLGRRLGIITKKIKMLECPHNDTIFREYRSSLSCLWDDYRQECTWCGKIIKSFASKEEYLKAIINNDEKELREIANKNKQKKII